MMAMVLFATTDSQEADFGILRQIFGRQASESELEHWAGIIADNAWLEHFKQHNERPIVQFADFLAWRLGSVDDSENNSTCPK